MSKGISILCGNILICGILIITYSINSELGRAVSMIVSGFIVSSLLAIVAWFINHSQLSILEKRNLITLLDVILCVVVFWLAAGFGDGSIFKIHKLENPSLADLAFGGGIFGLWMGFGVLFDYALLHQTPLSRFGMLGSLFGFSLMVIWYLPTDGLLFVCSVISTRITVSLLINRILSDKTQNNMMILVIIVLSLTFIVLPWTAFLSK